MPVIDRRMLPTRLDLEQDSQTRVAYAVTWMAANTLGTTQGVLGLATAIPMLPFGGFETKTKHVLPLHPSSARAIQRTNRKAECQRHVSTVSLGVNNMRTPFKRIVLPCSFQSLVRRSPRNHVVATTVGVAAAACSSVYPPCT